MPKNDELIKFTEKIDRFKAKEAKPTYDNNDNISASRICIELVSSVIAGILVGTLLDNWFKTKLIFKIIGLLLSCIAGFYSIYRLARKK